MQFPAGDLALTDDGEPRGQTSLGLAAWSTTTQRLPEKKTAGAARGEESNDTVHCHRKAPGAQRVLRLVPFQVLGENVNYERLSKTRWAVEK